MDWGEGQGCGERTIKVKFTEMSKIHSGVKIILDFCTHFSLIAKPDFDIRSCCKYRFLDRSVCYNLTETGSE